MLPKNASSLRSSSYCPTVCVDNVRFFKTNSCYLYGRQSQKVWSPCCSEYLTGYILYSGLCLNWHGKPVSWCILWLQHDRSASIVSVWLCWVVNIAPPVDCFVLNLMDWCLCFTGQCFIVSGWLLCWVQKDFVFWILVWK